MSQRSQPLPPPALPAPAAELVVHQLRFRADAGDPEVLQPVPGPPGTLDDDRAAWIGRLLECGAHADTPTLAFSRLPDRSTVLCRSIAPAGAEHEVEARVVIWTQGSEKRAGYAIDGWDAQFWNRGAGPALALGPPDLHRFAHRVRSQLASVLADARSLFAEQAGPQLLLAHREQADVARWIALVCASLPADAAERLTFTTFAHRPYAACQQIVGIAPDCADFGFTPEELAHTYRVRGEGARVSPKTEDPWAELAAALWLAERHDLITDDVRLPAGRPFDAGRLAVLALLEAVDVEVDALRVLDWLSRKTNTSGIAKDDKAVLTRWLLDVAKARPGEGPVWQAAGPALAALRLRAEDAADEAAMELGRVALGHAAADPAGVTGDPLTGLELARHHRNRLGTEFSTQVLTVLKSEGPIDLAALRGALTVARALALLSPPVLADLARRLAAVLLGAGDRADRAAVLDLLNAPSEPDLSAAVTEQLDRAAGNGEVVAVRELFVSPARIWLDRQSLDGTPVLRLIALSQDPHIRFLRGYDCFDALRHQVRRLDIRLLRVMGDLAWPDTTFGLPLADAARLGRTLSARDLHDSDFDHLLAETFKRHTDVMVPDEQKELSELAGVLKGLGGLARNVRVAADLLVETSRAEGSRRSLDHHAATIGELLAEGPVRAPVRDDVLKRLATLYVMAPADELKRTQTLPRLLTVGERRLLDVYGELHGERRTADEVRALITHDAESAAARFELWRALRHEDDARAQRIGRELIWSLIMPTMRTAGSEWAARVAKQFRRRDDVRDSWHRAWNRATAPPGPDQRPSRDQRTTHHPAPTGTDTEQEDQ